MRIKKFVDNDMIRLMRLVKEELGENAVIISTSQLEDGRSELVAAVENDDIEFINNTPEIYDSFYNDCFIRERLVYHQTEISTQSELLALCRQQAETLHEKDDLKILSSVLVKLFASYDILDINKPVKIFLGPQGSGKTTALIKTAAEAKIHGLSCALINADYVRAGAYAQVEALAKILQLPIQHVENSEQLAAEVLRYQRQYKLVLVDFPGLNPFVEDGKNLLRQMISAVSGEIIMVLDAGYNAYDAGEAARLYKQLGATCLLPTKLDLCRRVGGVLTAAKEGGLKLGRASVSANMRVGLAKLDAASLAALFLYK